uniref:DNA helicase n=1 Tax=Panagrellus redivivus TaxID=6233 RepID=A0A7E4WBS4_PANRE
MFLYSDAPYKRCGALLYLLGYPLTGDMNTSVLPRNIFCEVTGYFDTVGILLYSQRAFMFGYGHTTTCGHGTDHLLPPRTNLCRYEILCALTKRFALMWTAMLTYNTVMERPLPRGNPSMIQFLIHPDYIIGSSRITDGKFNKIGFRNDPKSDPMNFSKSVSDREADNPTK